MSLFFHLNLTDIKLLDPCRPCSQRSFFSPPFSVDRHGRLFCLSHSAIPISFWNIVIFCCLLLTSYCITVVKVCLFYYRELKRVKRSRQVNLFVRSYQSVSRAANFGHLCIFACFCCRFKVTFVVDVFFLRVTRRPNWSPDFPGGPRHVKSTFAPAAGLPCM